MPDARAQLAIAGIRVANTAVHAWGEAKIVSVAQAERLSRTAEQQLVGLESVTEQLKRDIADRKALFATVHPCRLP